MLRTSENETEILLDNKQLLGIFFVVAVLLGVAFYGGYMVGRGTTAKNTAAVGPSSTAEQAQATNRGATGGETHSFPADTGATGDQAASPAASSAPRPERTASPNSDDLPLGSPKRNQAQARESGTNPVDVETFAPQSGDEFLQVAAVGRDEATAVAEVLDKKGFHAHAVPKPGNVKIYRVLIGPIRNAGDLSSTRDALRRTGFREVILQRY